MWVMVFPYSQYASALQDLVEALKLAPNNRELRRLLMRVKDECKEQARLQSGSTAQTLSDMERILEDEDGLDVRQERRREETALWHNTVDFYLNVWERKGQHILVPLPLEKFLLKLQYSDYVYYW